MSAVSVTGNICLFFLKIVGRFKCDDAHMRHKLANNRSIKCPILREPDDLL